MRILRTGPSYKASMTSPVQRWNSQSLARQFLLAGGFVAICAMVVVGYFVASLIENAVTRNSAATTALYVDSVIAPLLPDMQTTQALDDSITRALDETLGQGALGKRLFSFRLWRSDGTILYSSEKNLSGKQLPLSGDLKTAFTGQMTARFNRIDGVESDAERDSEKPLLQIYNPVLQPWSGKVVAVSEFFEIANEFEWSLNQARLLSWLAVAAFTTTFFGLLSILVLRGSRTIDSQRKALNDRIGELSALLRQNEALRARVQRATQRATSLNESYLRRIGADLHDGPAQLVAYASLRLDSPKLADPRTPAEEREASLTNIKTSLDDAMTEIRGICSGLMLPHIETDSLAELLKRAILAHEQRTGVTVDLLLNKTPAYLSRAAKICIYRFVQEALNNGYRHAGGIGQKVTQSSEGSLVMVEVADEGHGFRMSDVAPEKLGLAGLRDRVESLGGVFHLFSSDRGTIVRMSLNIEEMEQA
ncbi:sensor histidine kinase [Agrobacterium radiobacter]|nr:sensor histidine kinase [Agrobacterium tumefaciens]NTA05940.1 sensor histidine kinase [Agrobacterium tumefaciens]NTA94937.1 sensor histidine kinase [Agrobacterium tumefaciens]NTB13586.1 sensor histidine kinase [Agrobacterium tumefaciens]SPZ48351.1 Signal transduction histidine kinase [Agrobacterium tumefaciens]